MSKPIRVLQVFAQMNRGGAETMIMNLYRNIDRSKFQFDFVVHTDEKCAYDDEIKSLGGMIFRIPRYNGKNHFQYKKAWTDLLKCNPEYKVIHGHVRSTASIYLRIAKKLGLTTIAHSHSTSSGKGLSAVIKNTFQYPIRYISDYFFACSKSAGVWLFGNKVCIEDNFIIINNAIDTKKFIFNNSTRMDKRKELEVNEKLLIGHVGRFNSPKNHDFLIDIFKDIYDKNNDVILMLVGDGELRHRIEKKVDNLGLNNNVIFTGIRSDIPELLHATDLLIFPSLYEGLPVTLIEAQAAGLRCLASDRITDEVRLTDLIEYAPLNKGENYWAERALELSQGYERRNMYNEIANAGYDIESVAKRYQEFIKDIKF